jgi:hypothetical protein
MLENYLKKRRMKQMTLSELIKAKR